MSIAFSLTDPMRRRGNPNEDPRQSAKGSDEATIGEVAREFAVSLRTLRFYEDRGLLQPRRDGANRFYSAADRSRLRAILKGKQLGFTLTEIRALIGAERGGDGDIEERLDSQQIADQIGMLERQRSEIETALARLRAAQQRRCPDQRLAAS
jgi:DNA-binding transcriptional MerR regulator